MAGVRRVMKMNTIDRIKLKMYVANKLELSLFPTSSVL